LLKMGKTNVNFVLVQLKRQTIMNIEEVYNIVQRDYLKDLRF